MHIVHITEFFSPLSETFIYNYAIGLRDRGHASTVVTLHRTNIQQRPYDDVLEIDLHARWNPIRVLRSVQRNLGIIEQQEQLFPIARKQLSAYLRKTRPDIVHAHFGPMGVLVTPIARKLTIPLVVFFGGYDITRIPRNSHWRRHYRELATVVSGVVYNSEFTARRLERLGFDRERMICAVGVDIKKFKYRDPAQHFDGRHVNCLFVGRLVDVKTPIPLVDAFALARKELAPHLDLHLTVAGDGPLRSALIEHVRVLNLSDKVHILGAVPHEAVRELLQQAHIYTQYNSRTATGEEEALGGSLLEASASGLPIVAIRSGGVPDAVLNGKTGYLVEEGDVLGMADRIVELARDPQKWTSFGTAGRLHVEANYTIDEQLNRTIDFYQLLVG